MKPLFLLFLFLCSLTFMQSAKFNKTLGAPAQSVSNTDAFLTVPELITKYGYPVESHNIITEDGYNLTAHRIPPGHHCQFSQRKHVIWLQHGHISSSADFIVAGPNRALGYFLADNCFDVWMGNNRGNRYSRRHVTLDPDRNKTAFWAFSLTEIGIYDVAASIDYALNVTGADGLYYAAHSMGTTTFFVCMSERPEYNSKIKLMSALAPVAYLNNMRNLGRLIAPFQRKLSDFLENIGDFEFNTSPRFWQFLGQTVCHQNSTIREFCEKMFIWPLGYTSGQLDPNLLPAILGHYPDIASHQVFAHFWQLVNTGRFQKFDFGREKNLELYGKPVPPSYALQNITTPIAIYYGENDWFAVPQDVERLANQLPNLKRYYRVKDKRYTHHDFLWGRQNLELLNKPLLRFLKKF